MIEIDLEKCIGCGVCVGVCPAKVFVLRDRKPVVVNADECVLCFACVDSCPVGAIKIESP